MLVKNIKRYSNVMHSPLKTESTGKERKKESRYCDENNYFAIHRISVYKHH
jgi:hypothetical protein